MNVRTIAAIFLGLAPAVFAQTQADPCATAPATCATLITTRATSEARIPNTVVDVSVAVNAAGKDMPEVQRALATQSNGLLAYLRGQKVERLITANINFSPDMRSQKNGPDKTVGYNGSEQVSFRTTPEKAPDILAGVLTNGANEITSTTFTPTEQEIADARKKLSEDATKTAVAQADAIARTAGIHVVAVRNINVDNGFVQPMRVANGMMFEAAKAQAPVPMQAASGDQQLSVTVNITAAAMR
ncbi:MAG TPA: SIMPL domain-containing protein [Acidobacteriaceae bacterium]